MIQPKYGAFIIAMLLVFAALIGGFLHYSSATRNLIDEAARTSTEAANDDIVEVIANLMSAETESLLALERSWAPVVDWKAFAATEEFREFERGARALSIGTRILKIKLYSPDGRTIYSTDPGQLGDDYSEREEVIHALRGRPTSAITQRDFFQSFTEDITDATIVSSYHALRDRDGQIIGVVEIYADRTEEFEGFEERLLSAQAKYLLLLTLFAFIAIGPLSYTTFGGWEGSDLGK